ncbi:MAG: sensor histidine kinase [Lachnospiraceae bacterium]|nr:sensor histidine kinase [Lachnospiraceae bacterium]
MREKAREIEFDVDAYTARLIGRENVSKLEGAVLEIVKNAYDADASVCCLYYSNTEDCVYIVDNGCGMKEEVLRTHWMTIGNSSKKNTYVTKNGRIQTGAKGIGRFALDRMSDQCDMLTISENGGLEWIVDWRDFDGSKKISEVKAKVYDTDACLLEHVGIENWNNKAVALEIKKCDFSGTGTAFHLTGLHDVWDERLMNRLRNHLENLLPPDVTQNFRIWFFDDAASAEEALIASANVESYDYRIDFQVIRSQVHIQIRRNEFDFRGEEKEVYAEAGFDAQEQAYLQGEQKEESFTMEEIGEKENYIGDFAGTLYFYKIGANKKDRERFYYKDITGRANLAKKFGGIKLYRDQFRVRPYGEYGDNDFDWLELSARRNRSPAGLGKENGNWRVGSEQILGTVSISRRNSNLEDAANRNGIQEGVGFSQLKRILLFVIAEFERDRQSVGRKLARYADKKDRLAAELESMRQLAEERKKWEAEQSDRQRQEKIKDEPLKMSLPPSANPEAVMDLVASMEQKQEEELEELRNENKMLQTLATTGIITNMFMHEIRTSTNNIGLELNAAYEAIEYDNDAAYALQNILRAIRVKKNFASWFGITIESIKKDKRKRRKHKIQTMLEQYMNTWKDILDKSDTELMYGCDSDIELWCFEFDIENIISNLIANSLASFDQEMDQRLEKREIHLDIRRFGNGLSMDYRDSGWGLIPKYKKRPELILEAFESGHHCDGEDEDDGTGMGMWIVNRTISEYNGTIDLSENQRRETGFYAKIILGGRNV